ncbi:MAG: major facilitator superfamily 1, partial [Clostridiales bacterium]|nr:major facilitator superfamily 1 [Clostridiales bacterium]
MTNNRTTLFCIVTSLYWFSFYAYAPNLSAYAKSLGASYKMIGLIVGSYGIVQMFLRIPLGIISDSLNKRKVFIIIGIGLSLVGSLGMWLFHSPEALLFFRALSGAGAATWVLFTVLFSSYYEGIDAPKAIGVITTWNFAGQLVSIIVGAFAAQFYGLESAFLVASIGALAAMILSLGLIEKKESNPKPIKLTELLGVSKDTNLIKVSVLAVFSQFISYASVYGFTPIVAKNIGASSFEIGMLVMFSTLPRVFSSYLSGTFCVKHFGVNTTLIGGFLISAVTCIFTPYITDVYLLYLNLLISGIGIGVILPLLMGLSIKNVQEEKRATAMGFFQAIYSLGMFLGPLVTGVL